MRLIDADALKKLLIEVLGRIKENPTMKQDEMHIISGCHMLCEMIEDAPTIDEVSVVHGRWYDPYAHDFSAKDMVYCCSRCNAAVFKTFSPTMNFCPNCGAKMDGGEQDA